MNQTIRAIIGTLLVLIIVFSGISICRNAAGRLKIDLTDQKLYTLSAGTKAVLAKINQPLTVKLFYTKTAAMKGPDQIKFFNNYYGYIKSLLEQYAAVSHGMLKLQLIDPRPYSDDEAEAIRWGLKQFRVSDEESFFFGLVVQTQFGIEKTIPFFTPDRQTFIEYDISYLIDTAIAPQKKKIGILSSLPVMGEDAGDYMAQLTGRARRPAWTIVEHLRSKYEVTGIPADADVNDINNVDILMVIHPKKLPEKTLFAIDQFILKGGRTIICIDPYSFADTSGGSTMSSAGQPRNSELDVLLKNWGLKMPANTFAGDRSIAEEATLTATSPKQTVIGLLGLGSKPGCFNKDNVITAELGDVRVLFAGALEEFHEPNQPKSDIKKTPLIMTTKTGNTFSITSPYELTILEPANLMRRFFDGNSPVVMGYLLRGRFKSSFPNGVEIKTNTEDPNKPLTTKLEGLTEAKEDCAVALFSDVDFISDILAYREVPLFGKTISGDNSALLFNTIEDMSGSSDLIAIRSRGSFKRPFTVVDEIEKKAIAQTEKEIANIDKDIATYNMELQDIIASAKKSNLEAAISEKNKRRRALEENIYQAERNKRAINAKRLNEIDNLGAKLQRANTLAAPAAILIIAILLGIRGTLRKRHYISHTSDA
jgi:ABC-2 type transport system permease protein